jgi:hypothetical protein
MKTTLGPVSADALKCCCLGGPRRTPCSGRSAAFLLALLGTSLAGVIGQVIYGVSDPCVRPHGIAAGRMRSLVPEQWQRGRPRHRRRCLHRVRPPADKRLYRRRAGWQPLVCGSAYQIGRITAGVVTGFPVPTALGQPTEIAADRTAASGLPGNWKQDWQDHDGWRHHRVSIPTASSGGYRGRPGAGSLWFTGSTRSGGSLRPAQSRSPTRPAVSTSPSARRQPWSPVPTRSVASPAGVVTTFAVPTPNSAPWGIAAGPDGNLWFTEIVANQIGRITTNGVVTEFAIPPGSNPRGIAERHGRQRLVHEYDANKIGRCGFTTPHPLRSTPIWSRRQPSANGMLSRVRLSRSLLPENT